MLVEQLLSRQNFLSWHDGVKFIKFPGVTKKILDASVF